MTRNLISQEQIRNLTTDLEAINTNMLPNYGGTMTGNLNLSGELNLSGSSTITGNSAIDGNLTVGGNSTISGNVNISGVTTAQEPIYINTDSGVLLDLTSSTSSTINIRGPAQETSSIYFYGGGNNFANIYADSSIGDFSFGTVGAGAKIVMTARGTNVMYLDKQANSGIRFPELNGTGFLATSGSSGVLFIDSKTYLTSGQENSLFLKLDASNNPIIGNLQIYKTDPIFRITDDTDDYNFDIQKRETAYDNIVNFSNQIDRGVDNTTQTVTFLTNKDSSISGVDGRTMIGNSNGELVINGHIIYVQNDGSNKFQLINTSGNTIFYDNHKITFGTSSDVGFYFDGSNFNITGVGDLDVTGFNKIDSAINIEAPSFVVDSGTSSHFLKGDGTLDSSAYLTETGAAANYLPQTGSSNSYFSQSGAYVIANNLPYSDPMISGVLWNSGTYLAISTGA